MVPVPMAPIHMETAAKNWGSFFACTLSSGILSQWSHTCIIVVKSRILTEKKQKVKTDIKHKQIKPEAGVKNKNQSASTSY